MGTLHENITALCEEAHITGSKMCVDLKLSKSMMTKLKQDPKKTITLDTARKIAEYFGVSISRILPEEQLISSAIDIQIDSMHYGEKEKPRSASAAGLMDIGFGDLNESNQRIVAALIEQLLVEQSQQ